MKFSDSRNGGGRCSGPETSHNNLVADYQNAETHEHSTVPKIRKLKYADAFTALEIFLECLSDIDGRIRGAARLNQSEWIFTVSVTDSLPDLYPFQEDRVYSVYLPDEGPPEVFRLVPDIGDEFSL